MKKIILMCLILGLIAGCSAVSLNKTQQLEIKEYVVYSNNLIEQLLKDEQPRKRLQPHRTRYRLAQQIIKTKFAQ